MKKILNQLFALGIKEDQPKYLSKKIYLSNIITFLVVFLIGIPYSIFSYFMFRSLVFIPMAAIVICAFVILLNYLGFNKIARIIIGVLPMLMAQFFVAYLIPPNGTQYFQMYVIAMGLSVIPFLIFDLREKLFIVLISIFILCSFMFGSNWYNNKLISDVDASIIIDGPLGTVNIFLGLTLMIVGVIVLSYKNFRSEITSEKLFSEMDAQSELVKNSENELKEKIIEIEKSQEEEKKRNWATHGIAEISTILRSDQDGGKLYDKITSYLTEYLDANQCGLFLVESTEYGEDQVLKLKSCYAYNRKKFVDKEISPGQGLIGQCFVEKSSIYLKDIPTGYTSITSGLGENTPNELLIVPLIINESIEGVIEFASFNQFEQYQIEFLEHLGETLASFININRINERTKLLLEETQQQAEEMKSQEEEMRQNMEELSATQEQSERQHIEMINTVAELEGQMNIINQGSLVSKTDRKGIITYVNDFFCEAAGYTREELIGQNHNIVRHPDMPKGAFKDIWRTIGSGNVWNGKVKNKTKKGGYYWVEANIGPVMGDDNKPKEYVGVRYLITDYVDNEKTMDIIRKAYGE